MLARNSLTKVCPCLGGRCLTATFSSTARDAYVREAHRRHYSTANTAQSIFSPFASTWDNVFEDIKSDVSVQPPPINPRSIKKMNAGLRSGKAVRPQAITASETQAIDEMFTQIFENTILHKDDGAPGSIGLGRPRRSAVLNNVYSRLRSHSQRLRWTTEADQELDRKKEEMELCETDAQLLAWAMREVFGAYARPPPPPTRAKTDAPASQPQSEPASSSSPSSSSSSSSPASSPPSPSDDGIQVHSSSYPHLLAALMRTFRDKYKDPHLALALFDHARHLSIASFVFGCTTPAYNELIETRWRCFRDLRAVVGALDEMRVNGIEMDGRTRLLGETIRREVGMRNLWQEESALDSGEVWELVARLERLIVPSKPRRGSGSSVGADADADEGEDGRRAPGVRRRKWNASVEEAWKRKVLEESKKETYQFDRWAPGNARRTFALGPSPQDKLKNALSQSAG
ncbi:hypothetical protein BD414DRAFT_446667 [Trametes punicea]|nr:hypothetical protein BD414DRAFT_446667 [Trametes punicea]